MKKLLALSMFLLAAALSGLAPEVAAQSRTAEFDVVPVTFRLESPVSLSLSRLPGLIQQPGLLLPRTNPHSYTVDFEPNAGLRNLTRTFVQSSELVKLVPFISLESTDKSGAAPSGMKIGSGLNYYFPLGRSATAFTTLKPSLSNLFKSPQRMISAGINIPVLDLTPAGGKFSLKISSAMDQQYHPIITIMLTSSPKR